MMQDNRRMLVTTPSITAYWTCNRRAANSPSAARQSSPAVRRNFVTLGVLSQNGRLQRSTDRIRAADPAEKRLYIVNDCILYESRATLLCCVIYEDAEIFSEKRIADRGFDANIGCDPGYDQCPNVPFA